MASEVLEKLRAQRIDQIFGQPEHDYLAPVLSELASSGVRFASSNAKMQSQYERAMRELLTCIKPTHSDQPILNEGGVYFGCWLESTGTINAEILSRFAPEVAKQTFLSFAQMQDEEGLFPYKLTPEGAGFNQIQLVTPLARSVWNLYQAQGRDKQFLQDMYEAMARYDAWIAKHRDTKGTGGVEAFCTFDTGHDASARFWHIPDTPYENNPKQFDPANPLLPFVAPDLTANIACQRHYLSLIRQELDGANAVVEADDWAAKAQASCDALFANNFCKSDRTFYDRDGQGRFVSIQSDVLLRVLACEIGDSAFFDQALADYLLNTRKFFAKFPFTSVALDDPRFDRDARQNSWCGPTNFLSIIRAPHAFEHHHRYVELTWAMQPILSALCSFEEFAQTIDPFTGQPGYTKAYSPTILCFLDFVERLCGILPRPDGHLWFNCLTPKPVHHRDEAIETAYARKIDDRSFELSNSRSGCVAYLDGEKHFCVPHGVRVVTDRAGVPIALEGLSANTIAGSFECEGTKTKFEIGPNQRLDLVNGQLVQSRAASLVPIHLGPSQEVGAI